MNFINIITKLFMIIFLFFTIKNHNIIENIKIIINHFLNIDTNENKKIKENYNNVIFPNETGIKLFMPDQPPIYKIGLFHQGTYLDNLNNYFKKHIYPVNSYNTKGSLDNIKKLINNQLDLAFINEDVLMSYIKGDEILKKELNLNKLPEINFSHVAVCFYESMLFITIQNSKILKFDDIKLKKYNIIKKINNKNIKTTRNAIIGVLKESTDSFHLKKILYISNIIIGEDVDIKYFNNYNELGNSLNNREVDIIYLTTNKKNEMLNELTRQKKCRFISPKLDEKLIPLLKENKFSLINLYEKDPFIINNNLLIKNDIEDIFQKKSMIGIYFENKNEYISLLNLCLLFIPIENNLNIILNDQTKYYYDYDIMLDDYKNDKINVIYMPQKESIRNLIKDELQKLNLQNNSTFISIINNQIFNKLLEIKATKLINDLKNRNKIMKNLFEMIFNKTENLNSFYQNINTYSFLDTFSTRIILVARNKLPIKSIEYLLNNFIKNIKNLQIDMNNFLNLDESKIKEILKKSSKSDDFEINKELIYTNIDKAFEFNELVSVKDIPIHKGAIKVYKKYKMIKTIEVMQSNI